MYVSLCIIFISVTFLSTSSGENKTIKEMGQSNPFWAPKELNSLEAQRRARLRPGIRHQKTIYSLQRPLQKPEDCLWRCDEGSKDQVPLLDWRQQPQWTRLPLPRYLRLEDKGAGEKNRPHTHSKHSSWTVCATQTWKWEANSPTERPVSIQPNLWSRWWKIGVCAVVGWDSGRLQLIYGGSFPEPCFSLFSGLKTGTFESSKLYFAAPIIMIFWWWNPACFWIDSTEWTLQIRCAWRPTDVALAQGWKEELVDKSSGIPGVSAWVYPILLFCLNVHQIEMCISNAENKNNVYVRVYWSLTESLTRYL